MGDYKVERLWRDAKLLEIGGGTNEAHHKVMRSFPGYPPLRGALLPHQAPSLHLCNAYPTNAAVQNMVRDIKKGGGRIA